MSGGAMDTNERDMLIRMETKLDVVLAGHTDHESRLRRLERVQWKMSGAASVIGGLIAAGITHVGHW